MAGTIEHYQNQISLARTEIKNLRQQLTALKHEHLKEITLVKAKLQELRCSNCSESATTTAPNRTNNDPSPSDDCSISFTPIGVIESPFQNKRGVPRQPSMMCNAHGAVVIDYSIFNNPEHALSGLEEFSHMWIIFHFHATESNSVPAKVAPPRLGGERRGVLATRSPHRPCAIGLSLVKIHAIEGNKIQFLGVDMVNGTPVLDIKPYIPQYDYPTATFEQTPTQARPPTEGNSDIAATMSGLNMKNDNFRSINPRVTQPIGIETRSSYSGSPPGNTPSPDDTNLTPVSPSPDSPPSGDVLNSPIRRPDTERGAPDGQERFTPPQSARLVNISQDGIRVAPWITNPPSQAYEVKFTDDVNNRLQELIGGRTQAFKCNIQSLLTEDPRSTYVKTRYPDHEYSCVLEDLSISCVFDSTSSVCTIIAVRGAEEMQQA